MDHQLSKTQQWIFSILTIILLVWLNAKMEQHDVFNRVGWLELRDGIICYDSPAEDGPLFSDCPDFGENTYENRVKADEYLARREKTDNAYYGRTLGANRDAGYIAEHTERYNDYRLFFAASFLFLMWICPPAKWLVLILLGATLVGNGRR